MFFHWEAAEIFQSLPLRVILVPNEQNNYNRRGIVQRLQSMLRATSVGLAGRCFLGMPIEGKEIAQKGFVKSKGLQ